MRLVAEKPALSEVQRKVLAQLTRDNTFALKRSSGNEVKSQLFDDLGRVCIDQKSLTLLKIPWKLYSLASCCNSIDDNLMAFFILHFIVDWRIIIPAPPPPPKKNTPENGNTNTNCILNMTKNPTPIGQNWKSIPFAEHCLKHLIQLRPFWQKDNYSIVFNVYY